MGELVGKGPTSEMHEAVLRADREQRKFWQEANTKLEQQRDGGIFGKKSEGRSVSGEVRFPPPPSRRRPPGVR